MHRDETISLFNLSLCVQTLSRYKSGLCGVPWDPIPGQLWSESPPERCSSVTRTTWSRSSPHLLQLGCFSEGNPSAAYLQHSRRCERGKIIFQDCLSHSYRARSPVAYWTYSTPVGHLRLTQGLRLLSYSTDKSGLDQFQTLSTKSHSTCQFLHSKHVTWLTI